MLVTLTEDCGVIFSLLLSTFGPINIFLLDYFFFFFLIILTMNEQYGKKYIKKKKERKEKPDDLF